MRITTETTDITGIILAGGKSTRMGTDKGFLNWKGKPFIAHIIRAAKPLVKEIVIVSNNPMYDDFGVTRLVDDIPDSGPLAGLYTGLRFSPSMWNMVLSCDIPLVHTALLKQLVKHIGSSENDIILFKCNGKSIPLIALYRRSCIKKCHTLLLGHQKRLRSLIENCRVEEILLGVSQARYIANINTPEDLHILKKDEDSN